MKEKFEEAELLFINICLADIITTSGDEDNLLPDDSFDLEL